MKILFTVYQTTNILNGKFYIGVHKTSNPNDSYMGSGKLIQRALYKYGQENFKKEILFIFDNSEHAFKKEQELVKVHKDDLLCYNLNNGGFGGWEYVNKNLDIDRAEISKRGNKSFSDKLRNDPEFKRQWSMNVRDGVRKSNKNPRVIINRINGQRNRSPIRQKHSEETKARLSAILGDGRQAGENCSSYGSRWMYLELETAVAIKRVGAKQLDNFLSSNWKFGRKTLPKLGQTTRIAYFSSVKKCKCCGQHLPYEKRSNSFCNRKCSAVFRWNKR